MPAGSAEGVLGAPTPLATPRTRALSRSELAVTAAAAAAVCRERRRLEDLALRQAGLCWVCCGPFCVCVWGVVVVEAMVQNALVGFSLMLVLGSSISCALCDVLCL